MGNKRLILLSLVIALLLGPITWVSAENKTLQPGDRGEAVRQLKLRLFDLGYFPSLKDVKDDFNKNTVRYLTDFQQANGLMGTGIADEATLALLYSKEAVKAPLPEDRPVYDVDPDSVPETVYEEPDGLTETGFLTPGSQPFVIKDRKNGYWLYLSDKIRVEVTRFYQAKSQIEWFEAYITYNGQGMPKSISSRDDGKRSEDPLDLGRENGAVLVINDDYYRYRIRADERVGVIVRDSEVQSDNTVPQNHSRIPSLEVIALFKDGRMQTFDSDAYTAQEYIDMGVTDTWAFGPILVQDGEVPRYFYSRDYRSYREPRTAVGMIAPNQYCALMVTGRKEGSRGATFGWMAEKMLAMGAKEALNLDGGGSAAIIFMDEILSKSEKNQTARDISGIIAFCDRCGR